MAKEEFVELSKTWNEGYYKISQVINGHNILEFAGVISLLLLNMNVQLPVANDSKVKLLESWLTFLFDLLGSEHCKEEYREHFTKLISEFKIYIGDHHG